MWNIYKLTGPNGKGYIGITSKTLDERFNGHAKHSDAGADIKLSKALRKYGAESFNKEVIDQRETKELAEQAEIYYIEKYDTYYNGYNSTKGGGGLDSETASKLKKSYWDSECSNAQRKKQSEQWKKQQPAGADWTGRKHTEETKEKIRAKNKLWKPTEEMRRKTSEGNKKAWAEGKFDNRPMPTEEHKRKISEGLKGRKQTEHQKKRAAEANQKTWIVISPDGIEREIKNLNAFCRENGLAASNLSRGGSKGWKARKKEG